MAYEIKKYNEGTWMIEDLLSETSLTRFSCWQEMSGH